MEHNPYFGLRDLFAEVSAVPVPDVWHDDSLHLEWLFHPLPCLGARPRSAPSPPSAPSPRSASTAAAAREERIRRLRNAQSSWQIPQWDRQGYEKRLRDLMQIARPPPNLSSIERSGVSRRLNSRKNPTFVQNEHMHMFRCSTTSALPLQPQVHLHLQYDPQNVRLELAIEISHLLAIAILFLLFLRSFF